MRKRRHKKIKQRISLKQLSFYAKRTLLSTGLFTLFTSLLILISFVGQPLPIGSSTPTLLPKQIAGVRVIAEIPFTYQSDLHTQRLIEQQRKRVPPVYYLDLEPFLQFKENLAALEQALKKLETTLAATNEDERAAAIENFVQTLPDQIPVPPPSLGTFRLDKEDVTVLLTHSNTTPQNRWSWDAVFKEGIHILRDLYHEGILDNVHLKTLSSGDSQAKGLPLFQVHRKSSHFKETRVKSEEEALRILRIHLAALQTPPSLTSTIFHILKTGIGPNLVYDPEKTEANIQEAIQNIEPVWVDIVQGQTLIEPDVRVTPEMYERFSAYRHQLREAQKSGPKGIGVDYTYLLKRSLLALLLLLSIIAYLSIAPYPRPLVGTLLQSDSSPTSSEASFSGTPLELRQLLLAALIVLLNLGLIRLLLELGHSAWRQNYLDPDSLWLSGLPYALPIAFAPILLTIMLSPVAGVLGAVVISTLTALMQNNVPDLSGLLATLLASFIGISLCRDTRFRVRVVRAAAVSGFVFALCALPLGLLSALPMKIIAQQMLAALSTGLITGIVVIGLLPLLENLFKQTTDITLLELTDYNHPLLRRMQVEAPGTYHHSLLVANLAERAAVEIQANPLACRACALFHDIGKLNKPKYFIENQSDQKNPHNRCTPSGSARILKNHVKEGVAMAVQYRLPQIVIDVIQQHHGTSLIQYFYEKAKKTPSETKARIDEAAYRYKGPKPRFKESTIIFFADAVEAASRTLKKISPQSVEDLISQLFQERMDDHQLAECPLTLEEIHKIQKSFAFTLLKMRHARIEYPSKSKTKATSDPPPSQ